MAIHVSCTHCKAAFKAPDDFAGKSGKCPKCGQPIIVPALPPVPVVAELIEVSPVAEAVALTKPCLSCGESVLAVAKKCKHCGESLDGTKKTDSNAGLAAVLSFIVPGMGQVYRGRFVAALCWFVFTPLGYMAFVVPGLVLHGLCIYDAYRK